MPETTTNARLLAARSFVRSLNILLKFARMYDFGHPRTAKQYEIAWSELRTALGSDNESGLLLAVSGEQLLLDGTPLESAAAERSFARMLSAAGIASIHFSPNVTQVNLERLVRGFPANTTSTKPGQLATQLKAALEGDPNIHVNEVCFVPADSAVARSTVAAQLAARTMGFGSSETDELLKDPEKLLQLIVAAEGARGRDQGAGPGNGPGNGTGNGSGPEGIANASGSPINWSSYRSHAENTESAADGVGVTSDAGTTAVAETPARRTEGGATSLWANASSGMRANHPARGTKGSMTLETGLMTLQESELQGILQVLSQIGRSDEASKEKLDANAFQSRLSVLPRRARFTVSQALSALAAQAPVEATEKPTLVRLAEHIAVRFALESYERGDVQVNAVRQMLQDINQMG